MRGERPGLKVHVGARERGGWRRVGLGAVLGRAEGVDLRVGARRAADQEFRKPIRACQPVTSYDSQRQSFQYVTLRKSCRRVSSRVTVFQEQLAHNWHKFLLSRQYRLRHREVEGPRPGRWRCLLAGRGGPACHHDICGGGLVLEWC